jgi:hypothetical protein
MVEKGDSMADKKKKSEKTDWLPIASWTLAIGLTQDDLETLVSEYRPSATNISKAATNDRKGIRRS